MNNTILYTLIVLIWGTTWYAITFQTGVVSPILSVGYRFIIAALCLALFQWLRRRKDAFKFSRKDHMLFLLFGFLTSCLNYIVIYFSSLHLTSGLVAILFSTIMLMNILNQRLLFKIEVRKQVLIGSFIGLFGIVLVFLPELKNANMNNALLWGVGLCLAATYSASLGNMVSLTISRKNISVLSANIFGMMYGGILSLLIGVISGVPLIIEPTAEYILSLFYLAVFGSAIAFGFYFTLVRNIGADKVSYAAILFPIVALVISTLFEGYVWSIYSITGLCLTIIGNIIAMTNKNRMSFKKKEPPETTI